MVYVHVETPRPVILEGQTQDGTWTAVCDAPCDREVEPGSYRVRGKGVRTSETFTLEGTAKRVTVEVDPASSGAPGGAILLIVVGSIGLAPGAALTALIAAGEIAGAIFICPIAAAFETVKSRQGQEYVDCLGGIGSFFGAGYRSPWVWGPAIGGGVLLTGGIVWAATASSASTGVRQVTGGVEGEWGQGSSWRTLRLPRVMTTRLVDVRF
jgi:hypothetical protein